MGRKKAEPQPAAGPNPRRPLSPETCAKISAALKGHEVSAETRARIAAVQKGRPGHPLSPETRAKMAAAHKGRHFSPEHRAKIGAASPAETKTEDDGE